MIKKHKLPNLPAHRALRVMTKEDVPGVHKLVTTYLSEK